jgi:hypothetical protein
VEYSVNDPVPRSLKCMCCGSIWHPKIKNKSRRGWVFALAGIVLLIAMASFVAVIKYLPSGDERPLVAQIESVVSVPNGIVVHGVVKNKSKKIQGVPDLIMVFKNSKGMELFSQKFAPPVPLLDADEEAAFVFETAAAPINAAKIAVEVDR